MSNKRHKSGRRSPADPLTGMEQVDDGLPKSSEERAILRQRAEQLAQRPPDEDEEVGIQFIHFRLGRSEEYGIPYRYAEEILPAQTITRVPCVAPIFSGVTNRRGEMLAVISLKRMFGLDAGDQSAGRDPGIIVVRGAGLTVGLLVDDVLGNEEYLSSKLAAAPPSERFGSLDWVEGICAGRITILNLERMLADPGLHAGSPGAGS